eukprot:m.1082344 g.1082344  ORF g.1082344 m.1082344 type:complete len:1099 (-) comp24265_c0_seq3:255-3551(-)
MNDGTFSSRLCRKRVRGTMSVRQQRAVVFLALLLQSLFFEKTCGYGVNIREHSGGSSTTERPVQLGQLPPGRGQPSPSVGWIRDTLQLIVLNISNITLINNTLFFSNITGFTCKNVSLGVTNTTYHRPLDMDLTLNKIGSKCRGAYALVGKVFGDVHKGELDVNVSVRTLDAHVQLYRGNHSLIWGANVTKCSAKIKLSLAFGNHEGWLKKYIVDLFDNELQSTIQTALCKGLSTWANHSLGQAISNISQVLEPWILPVKPAAEPPLPANTSYISLFTNPVVMFLNYMASSYIGADGTCGVDKLVNFFLPGADLGGSAIDNVNVTFPVNQNGTITATLGLTDYNISGLASFEDFSLFEAISAHELSTDITLEKLNFKMGGFLELDGLQAGGATTTAPVQWFTLTADLDNSHFAKWTEYRVDSQKMHALHGTQSGDVGCLESTTDMVNTTYLDLNVTLNDFILDLQGGNVDADIDALLNGIFKLVTMSLEPVLPKAVRGVLAGPGRDQINAAMVDLLQNATCAPVADDKSTTLTKVAGASGGGAVLAVLLLWACTRGRSAAQDVGPGDAQDRSAARHGDVGDASTDELQQLWENSDDATVTPSRDGEAMLLSPHVPFVLKSAIVVGIVGTLGLFLCGVVAKGAEVIPTVGTNRTIDVTLPPLYYLSLLGSIRDSYHAKAFAVSYFIGASNVVWPVLRTVLLVYAVLPPGGLSLKWCNRIALVCDIMGKWVLAQNFVATLMMIAFRYAAVFHGIDEHGEPIQGSVHMFMLFDWWGWWGIVTCFLTGFATTQCIFLGIHYMRSGGADAAAQDKSRAMGMKSTWENFDDVVHSVAEGKVQSVCQSRARPVEPVMFVVLALGTLGFFVYAIVTPAFTFVNYGLTRMFQDASGVAGSREYSLWHLIQLMPDPHFVHHNGNMLFLQVMLVAVAVVAPMLQVVCALVLYFHPMTRRGVERWVWVIEAISAWASMDVMVVSIVAGFMQIGLFAQFIVGNKCEALIGLLHNPKMDPLLHHDDKCLDAKAIIHVGTIFLGIVAVLCHTVAAYAVEVSTIRDGHGTGCGLSSESNDTGCGCLLHWVALAVAKSGRDGVACAAHCRSKETS